MQKATFGMKEYEWLNYNEVYYGILVSNDGIVFSGFEGTIGNAV